MIAFIWVLSLFILIATIVLVYKMLVTSNEFFSSDKPFPIKLFRVGTSRDKSFRHSISLLNSKIKSLEDSNAYYEIQFSKLQLQMNSGQINHSILDIETEPGAQITNGEEEDWEEMYYQENEKKVQIENELDEALQSIEDLSKKLLDKEDTKEKLGALKSTYDARMIEMTSIQNQLAELQKKLEGAAQRESELNTLLQKEIDLKRISAKIENENVRLRSETENQKKQIIEMYSKEKEFSKKLARTRELQSQAGMYEDEKNRKMNELKKQMENNRIFAK